MCPAVSRNGTKKRWKARPNARDSENRWPLQARPRNRFAIGGNSGILGGAGAGVRRDRRPSNPGDPRSPWRTSLPVLTL